MRPPRSNRFMLLPPLVCCSYLFRASSPRSPLDAVCSYTILNVSTTNAPHKQSHQKFRQIRLRIDTTFFPPISTNSAEPIATNAEDLPDDDVNNANTAKHVGSITAIHVGHCIYQPCVYMLMKFPPLPIQYRVPPIMSAAASAEPVAPFASMLTSTDF